MASMHERLVNFLSAVLMRIDRPTSWKADSMSPYGNASVVMLVVLAIGTHARLPDDRW